MKKSKSNNLSNELKISLSVDDLWSICPEKKKPSQTPLSTSELLDILKHKKFKISDKTLRNLIRFHARVLDTKEVKAAQGSDLGVLLIQNLCNLKPPKKNLVNMLAKSLKKLERLNPLFIPLLIGRENRSFSILIYASSIKKKFGEPTTSLEELKGNTIHFGNKKVMILLNTTALGFYSEDVFFHELLHVVDDIIAPDSPTKKRHFHELVNQKYDNILAKTAKIYKHKQKKAYQEFARWLEKTSLPFGHKNQIEALKRAIERIYYDKYKLWAADENLAEEILSTKKFLGREIDNSEEVFAYSVQYYLAGPHRRKILRKRDLKLYNLVRNIIIPALKKIRPG